VLVRGESSAAPSGRADDFSWPRAGGDDGGIIPAAIAPTAVPTPQRPTGKKGAPAPAAEKGKRGSQAAEKTAPSKQTR